MDATLFHRHRWTFGNSFCDIFMIKCDMSDKTFASKAHQSFSLVPPSCRPWIKSWRGYCTWILICLTSSANYKDETLYYDTHSTLLKSITFYTWWNSNTCHFPPNICVISEILTKKMSYVLWIGLFHEKKQTYTYPLERHANPPNLKGTPGEPSKCLSLCWAGSGTYLNFIKYKMKLTLVL